MSIDLHSATWKALARRAQERLLACRAEIETSGVPAERTAELRGAINELKSLLALAEPAPNIPSSTAPYV